MQPRQYIAIDLKSFYASVECVERGLDPLDTCLVVADMSRTEKTICLAVSPALKGYAQGADHGCLRSCRKSGKQTIDVDGKESRTRKRSWIHTLRLR